jgi:hypothetical protein
MAEMGIPAHGRNSFCRGRALVVASGLACFLLPPGLVRLPAETSAAIAPAISAASPAVGDAVCLSCHQAKAAYAATAHAHTSSLPSAESIHGRFEAGANTLRTANPDLYFLMEAKAAGFFQTAILRSSPTEAMTRSESIDLVVGSGRKGQTYLFWDGDALFQLPVSYWTEIGGWVNSPGYVDGTANFERPVAGRCLECHATAFASQAPPENAYRRTSLVPGITCEKCHGPGAEHVARYRSAAPPRTPAEGAIVNPARLSRARQIDGCALCHDGIGRSLTPPLSFRPGDDLDRHVVFPQLNPGDPVDVHGGQVQLLARSRCFQSSPAMTCTTCHDVHQPQRDLAAMAGSCLQCHQVESCRDFPRRGHAIDHRCIECHMPLQETAQIVSTVNGRRLQPKVRNHQIAIYPENASP